MEKVIILGSGKSWRQCPFDGEVWAAGGVLTMSEFNLYSKIAKVFAFDDYNLAKNELRLAKKYGLPIVSHQPYATEKYPLDEILRDYKYYFRNTVSFMLAYAIFKGYEKISLYGVDQGPEWEYITSKPYVSFWLGVATGRGIEWELASTSTLMEPMADAIERETRAIKNRAGEIHRYITSQMKEAING